MALSFDELIAEYDDLADDVASSNHKLFWSNLRRWFQFIDGRPELSGTVRRLESSINFAKWREEGLIE
jgi:hypothetical protein